MARRRLTDASPRAWNGRMTDDPARSFGRAASVYQAARPGYPTEAVAWLVGDAVRVLDLGAGTGKLTAALVALDREVVAVGARLGPKPPMFSQRLAEPGPPLKRNVIGRRRAPGAVSAV